MNVQSDMFFQDHQLPFSSLKRMVKMRVNIHLQKEIIIEQYFILSIMYFIQLILADEMYNPFQVQSTNTFL